MNKKEYFTPSVKVAYLATKECVLAGSVKNENEMDLEEGNSYNL